MKQKRLGLSSKSGIVCKVCQVFRLSCTYSQLTHDVASHPSSICSRREGKKNQFDSTNHQTIWIRGADEHYRGADERIVKMFEIEIDCNQQMKIMRMTWGYKRAGDNTANSQLCECWWCTSYPENMQPNGDLLWWGSAPTRICVLTGIVRFWRKILKWLPCFKRKHEWIHSMNFVLSLICVQW